MPIYKRFTRNRKYYVALRDRKGRIISTKRWHQKFKIKDFKVSKKVLKASVQVSIQKKRRIKAIHKAVKTPTKKQIISKIKFKKVTELRTKVPIKYHRAVMVIEFRFEKLSPNIIQFETGYSNKMRFPAEFKKGYNLCLRRAMSKIGFSPDNIRAVRIEYNQYVPNSSNVL